MKAIRPLIISCLALLLVLACSDDKPKVSVAEIEQATDAPDHAIEASARALQENNLNAFVAAVLPPEHLDRVKAEFDEERKNREITDEERAEFAQTMEKLTADGAEEQLMAEIEPQLTQMAAQVPMMISFGQMMAAQGIEESQQMTIEQKETAQQTLSAIFTKLQSINLADKELARKAVDVTVETARALDLKTLDDVQALSFEQMLEKGGKVMEGTKEILALYDFDINEMLASVDAEVLSEQGETATVQVKYDLFGTPQMAEAEMIRKNDRWFGATVVEELNKPDLEPEDAMLNTPATQEPETVIAQPEVEEAEEEVLEDGNE